MSSVEDGRETTAMNKSARSVNLSSLDASPLDSTYETAKKTVSRCPEESLPNKDSEENTVVRSRTVNEVVASPVCLSQVDERRA